MSELALHLNCACFLRAYARNDVMWFHVPNGERRDGRTAVKLKDMGTRPGVADFIVIAQGRVHGIELKDGGSQSKAQQAFQCDLERAGGHYHVARSLEQFIGILNAIGAVRRMVSPAGLGARTPEAHPSGEHFTEPDRALA